MILTEYDEERHYRSIRREGYEEGKADALLIVLERLGNVPSDFREKILEEKDTAILDLWLKAAVQAESMEEFAEKTQL